MVLFFMLTLTFIYQLSLRLFLFINYNRKTVPSTYKYLNFYNNSLKITIPFLAHFLNYINELLSCAIVSEGWKIILKTNQNLF